MTRIRIVLVTALAFVALLAGVTLFGHAVPVGHHAVAGPIACCEDD